jgi:hypothetical protein
VFAVVHDYGEVAMKYYHQEKHNALLPYGKLSTRGMFYEQAPTVDVRPAVETCRPKSERDSAYRDYSEEAIPERDPAYRLPVGTGYEQATVEAVSAEVRRDLARRLQELGMSRTRATFVASL